MRLVAKAPKTHTMIAAALVIWPAVYKRIRLEAQNPLLLAHGTVSRRDGTLNIVVDSIRAISVEAPALKTKDWG